jgi:type I restriction enzyme M protein
LVDLPQENLITNVYSTERKITDKGLKNSSAKLLPINSVIVSSRATIGRVGIAKVELATNQGFKNIIVKNSEIVDVKYLAYFMTTKKEEMLAIASGGTFKEISKSSFEKIKIPLPDLSKQKEIAKQFDGQSMAVEANVGLIEVFDNQIKEKISEIW